MWSDLDLDLYFEHHMSNVMKKHSKREMDMNANDFLRLGPSFWFLYAEINASLDQSLPLF